MTLPPPPPPRPPSYSNPIPRKLLYALLQKWAHRIENKFRCAEQEKSDFGRRLIEHGAVNIFNCADDLSRLLDGDTRNYPVTDQPTAGSESLA